METVKKFRNIYRHVDDVDLFSGGLAEKPVKGAVVGPTFACIIAQQFANLRKGDRFWYENGYFPSSFTPAQLQQIKRTTFSNILCQTMDEIETIQPFVLLTPDNGKNKRLSCRDPLLKNFDLGPWIENDPNDVDSRSFSREGSYTLSEKRRNTILKNRKKTKPIPTTTTSHTVVVKNNKDTAYNRKPTERPLQVNINIQYYPPNPQTNFIRATTIPPPRHPSSSNYYDEQSVSYPVFIQSPSITSTYNQPHSNKPSFTETRPTFTIGSSSNFNDDEGYGSYNYRPPQMYNKPTAENYNKPVNYRPSDYYDEVIFEDVPFITSNKPAVKPGMYKPIKNHFLYNNVNKNSYDKEASTPVKVYSTGYVQKIDSNEISDKLDFNSRLVDKNKKFVKISSVKSEATISSSSVIINTVMQREGDVEITEENDDKVRLVDVDVAPSENDNKNWLIYDETEKMLLTLDMPSVSSQTESTEDLPHPIKKWRNFEE